MLVRFRNLSYLCRQNNYNIKYEHKTNLLMKKNFLIAILMLLPLGMMADGNYVTIVLTEAGTLQERLIESGYDSVDGLTVSGKFNSLDLKYLHEATGRLANLVVVGRC